MLTTSEHEEVERVLKNFERDWAPRMSGVSLVTELNVPRDEVNALLDAFGTLMNHRRSLLLGGVKSVPACVAVALTASAVEAYESGGFWPGFFGRLECYGGAEAQTAWGGAFLYAVDHFDLPPFKSDDRRYIGPIVAHAGIPNYCLSDYFLALDMAIRRVGSDADTIASWAVPRVDTALANIDRPVRTFLARGDEFSVDFIDRSIDLLLRLNRDEDPSQAQLPERVVVAARQHLEGLAKRGRLPRSMSDDLVEARAKLSLDPLEGELTLTLPAIPRVDEDLVWNIASSDTVDVVVPAKQMGGRHIGVREATFAIRRPSRSLTITAHGVDRVQEIDLVDPDDPILFFNDAGEPISAHLPLPGTQVWALYAPPSTGLDPGLEACVLQIAPAPLGWTGWSLALLDLKGVSAISLGDTKPSHPIRNDWRVSLETHATASHVRSSGLPIHSVRPTVHIPDGVDAVWRLTVVDIATHATVTARDVRSSADVHDTTDPFLGLPSPVVGTFAVSMRGPLGKGISRTIAIAEGLVVECSTSLRLFTRDGLSAAEMDLSGADLNVAHPVLGFTAQDVEKSTTIASGGFELELLATPPAMAIALALSGTPGPWEHTALRCASEDIASTELILRLPRSAATSLRVVSDDGRTLYTLEETTATSKAGDGHQAQFKLRAIADVVATAGSCTIELGDERRIRLLRIAPRVLAHGALETQAGVQLVDFAGGSVSARVWSLFEPLITPVDLRVPADGHLVFPSELAECGAVAIALTPIDPWTPSAPPINPRRFEDHYIWRTVPDFGRDSTLALAGAASTPIALSFDEAWALLGVRAHAPRHMYKHDVVDVLTSELRRRPTEAIASLGASPHSGAESVALLVASGLIWTNVESRDEVESLNLSDEDLATAIAASPLAGALLATRYLSGDDSPEKFTESWAAAVENLGDAFREILTGKPDPHASDGRLADTRFLDRKDREEYTQLVAQLNVVPRAALDADTRFAGALEIFGQRRRTSVTKASGDAWTLANAVVGKLEKLGATPLAGAISARTVDRHAELPVASLGTVSLAFAVLARLASRGLTEAITAIPTLRPHLETLSRYAPRLLISDIILAEALVCALLAPSHPTFTQLNAKDSAQ